MAAASPEVAFGTFRLDPSNARLNRGRQAVPLKPKAFDVLAHLVRHAGRLVTQDELLHSVWPDTIVGDSSLKSCVRQIRRALGDRVRNPKYIETVHRRGYRFIAPINPAEGSPPPSTSSPKVASPSTCLLVGRESELRRLDGCLEQASAAQRQLVFVSGGPGSGKTALVEAFLERIDGSSIWVAAAQCFEHFGSGEAYLPVLEALGRLARSHGHDRLLQVLSSHAPTWLAHLPGLLPKSNPSTPEAPAVPMERMLRELAEAVERLTADTTLVLILEDLHWADYSTLDLVSSLARRREASRLLVIATYRPVEAVLSGHPLRSVKQDLQSRGYCHDLPIGLLSKTDVGEYLAARLPGAELSDTLTDLLHQRTEGHPLFLVGLVNDWQAQGVLIQQAHGWELTTDLDALVGGVPANVRALIEKQVERLGRDELRVLEGASVAGVEFAVAAAAAAIEVDLAQAEECCERLDREYHFIRPTGMVDWPDGTVTVRYRFVHELYHRVVAERISDARRRLLHQRLGEWLEAAYGDHAGIAAAELALHFEKGRDSRRAVHYFGHAADRAVRQYAHREAIDYLRRGLSAVERLPAADRADAELPLQVDLGMQLQVTHGFATPLARRAYERARELCRKSGGGPLLFPILWGLWLYHKARSDLPTARDMAEELFALAEQSGDPALTLQAHQALAVTKLCAGEPVATRAHMECGTALYDPRYHHTHSFHFGQDPGVACQAFGAVALWLLGYPEQAVAVSREAARLSHMLVQPSSQALALHFAAMVHQCCGDAPAARACAELELAIAKEQGFSFWQAGAKIMRGWAVAEAGDRPGGIMLLREGIEAWQATGSVTYRTYFLALLADVLARDGQTEASLQVLAEGLSLVEQTSERLFEAELYRLRGESLRTVAHVEAEACFHQAIAVAQGQQARSLELRTVTSLATLERDRGRPEESRRLLTEILDNFTEGFGTLDLLNAKRLLTEIV